VFVTTMDELVVIFTDPLAAEGLPPSQ